MAGNSCTTASFSEGLSFPEWYGNNLDALNDCLTDINEETLLKIENGSIVENYQSEDIETFLQTLTIEE